MIINIHSAVNAVIHFMTLTAACQGLTSLHRFPDQCQFAGPPGRHRLQKLPTLYLHTSVPHPHPAAEGSSSAPCNKHWYPFL